MRLDDAGGRDRARRSTKPGPLLALALSAVLLLGCAVHPQVIGNREAVDQTAADLSVLATEQPAPQGPVSLYEAMAWAIRYNRERRVKILESALAQRQHELAEFDMLPTLTAQAGYTGRDPESASYSESIQTGNVSLEPSTSQDKSRSTADATFTWDLLDFGLSYIRARQQADRHLIALEQERKAVQILLRDVRKAWWEALSAQRLLKRIPPLAAKVRRALEQSRQVETARLQKPMEALGYQRSLLQILRTLQALRQELGGAKARLATLMGLAGPRDLVVADPGAGLPVPAVGWDNATMEQAALVMRPELGQARYQGSISRRDAHAALLGVLPTARLDTGLSWDSNSYLMDEAWSTYGTKVSWNLLNVFRGPRAMDAARAKQEVVREQRLALSMAVLMQVHLAVVNHAEATRLYGLSSEYLGVQERILEQIRAMASALEGQQALIREELNQLVAEIRRDKAYAEVQDSFGRLLVSVGVDLIPAQMDDVGLDSLAAAIRTNLTVWQHRDLREYLGLPDLETEPAAARPVPVPVQTAATTPPTAPDSRTERVTEIQNPPAEPPLLPAPDGSPDAPDGNDGAGAADAASIRPTPEPIRPPAAAEVVAAAPPAASVPGRTGRTRFARLHLRKGPSVDAPIIGKAANKGETVTILGKTREWFHVEYQGRQGYMFRRYVEPPRVEARTTATRLHLRNGPSIEAPIIGKIAQAGETVWVLEDKGDWCRIEYNGHRGFVSAPYLDKTGETAPIPGEDNHE